MKIIYLSFLEVLEWLVARVSRGSRGSLPDKFFLETQVYNSHLYHWNKSSRTTSDWTLFQYILCMTPYEVTIVRWVAYLISQIAKH